MPSHLRELDSCKVCGKPATHELFNTRNAPLGRFCARHAKPALAERLAEEQAASGD